MNWTTLEDQEFPQLNRTTKLSKYVDQYIQPHTRKLNSYICDTTDFQNKINDTKTITKDAILVSVDIRCNIKDNERHLALGKRLKRIRKYSPADVITALIKHMLILNNFNFNRRCFIQTKRCAIETVTALSYTTIYMDKFRKKTNLLENYDWSPLFTQYTLWTFSSYTLADRQNWIISLPNWIGCTTKSLHIQSHF